MKKKYLKITSLMLCMCIILAAIGSIAYAGSGDSQAEPQTQTVRTTAVPSGEEVACKDETVYVLIDAEGSVKKIIVSDWISNAIGKSDIEDLTDLQDIEVINSDAGYTVGGDNTKVWNAQGNDIYYQGNIDKELPIAMSVTYKLDGQYITPDELAGKSGKVTIRFDYENRQYEMVEINGKREKIYVPFVALTGMILDNSTFRNIEISGGRIVNDGDRTIIIGFALPGMQESLGVDTERLEIPDYIEITADATDFSLGMTVTVVTNELFNDLDSGKILSAGDLEGTLAELTDAMDQLIDGSSQLYDGLDTLLEKSGALVGGIDQLSDGALQLKNGASDLDAGAAELQSGAQQLYAGLQTLDANSVALNQGGRQVFETLLATAQTQLSDAGISVPAMTPENYAEVLSGVIASLDESAVYEQALAAVTAAVEAQRDNIEAQVTAAVQAEVEAGVAAAVRAEIEASVTGAVKEQIRPQVEAAVRQSVSEQVILAATGMDPASYEAAVANGLVDEDTQAAIQAAIEEKMASDEVLQIMEAKIKEQLASDQMRSIISENTDAQMETDDVKRLISSTIAEKMGSDEIAALIAQNVEAQVQKAISENMASQTVQSQLAAASEGAQRIISLKTSLDQYNAFYLGLIGYTSGVSQAASGAGELKDGIGSLKAGSGQLLTGAEALYTGSLTLQSGAGALIDGITQLRNGAQELSDGLKEFNEKGIQELVEAVDGDLECLLDRLNAVRDVSHSYRNFSGISDEMDGQVKFIYRTEEIGQ